MIPLPENPTVVILIDDSGKVTNVAGIATNVSPDLNVQMTNNPDEFAELSKGKPFVDTNILMEPCCGDCGCAH